ncbi:DUF1735 domain-containing protein [Capnocytophaga sputigena]|uniref:DUF1735 domain-containing protein n=1 Tax=Capnocytophaga sputigena TaxID=1019 RepID=UPI00241E105C
MHKSIKKSMIFFIAGILFSCGKEDITIEKNESTTWEIDKSIVDDDIRTRIGYDPREQQAYFYKTEVDLPMFSFADLAVKGTNTAVAELRLTQKTTQDTKISLVYDASSYEKVKENYTGYELGTPNLVQLIQSEIIVPKGGNIAKFEITSLNDKDFNKKVILPFKLKIEGDKAKILKGSDIFVVKVFPKEAVITVDSPSLTRVVTLDAATDALSVDFNDMAFTITSDTKISEDISLGLIRDEAYTSRDLAPLGTETVIEKVPFKNVTTAKFTFKFNNLNLIKRVGRYTIPLKLVAYDANGGVHTLANIKPKVYITTQLVYPKNNIETSNSLSVPSGNKIAGVTGNFQQFFNLDKEGFDNMLDGDETTFARFASADFLPEKLGFTFGDNKKLKTIRLKVDASSPIKTMVVYTGADEQVLGYITFNASTNWYVITFKKAITIADIYLAQFGNDQEENQFKIYEVEFYEQ